MSQTEYLHTWIERNEKLVPLIEQWLRERGKLDSYTLADLQEANRWAEAQ